MTFFILNTNERSKDHQTVKGISLAHRQLRFQGNCLFRQKNIKQRTKRKTLDKFVAIGKDKKITDSTAAQAEESTVGE